MNLKAQKYKVFFNKVLIRIETQEGLDVDNLYVQIKEKDVHDSVNWGQWLLRKEPLTYQVLVADASMVFNTFKLGLNVVFAAGGIVSNKKGEYLTIFRNGKWDLPKGKLEQNELIENCALREVEEETGVNIISVSKLAPKITYHVYLHKKKFVLKPTYWFEMKANDLSDLIPQFEEGIEQVLWLSLEQLKCNLIKNSYPSILSLFLDRN